MTTPSRLVSAGFSLLLSVGICGPFLRALPALAQAGAVETRAASELRFDTEAVAPQRFIAAHGRKGLISGNASSGLEVWVYPFQIVSGYEAAFRVAGSTTAIRGADILRRVTYEPDSITRTYLGPGFTVREKFFVPLDEGAAVITYQVDSPHPVEIDVHAVPVLNLMWPGALGGQTAAWNTALSGFMLTDLDAGFSAVVGSPAISVHDEVLNSSQSETNSRLGFTLHPDKNGAAQVFFVLNPAHAADPGAHFRKLMANWQALESATAAHVQAFANGVLHVETPDAQVNRALAWAEVALDQAWVCNPDLGCGYVGGYGPSRAGRRPQYDWFFGGDGLVAADGALAMGDNEHTRQELEFILRYQDRHNGMIWHELSQSAGMIDWAGRFPYMFVHVDITFQFLASLDRYAVASGDSAFIREHWRSIEAAYGYCRSVIDSTTALPRIPKEKEGGDEQDRLTDELGLSTSWVQAAQAYAHLSTLAGHTELASEARLAAEHARTSIATRYWSARRNFWVAGYNEAGEGAPELRSGPGSALSLQLFKPEQSEAILDKLASAAFQTDWGTRSVADDSLGYDPGSYAKGSVWAWATASLAQSFWDVHHPAPALAMWRTLIPWSTLDSYGHLDEVLAGDSFHSQTEAVPEQTWSSAGFLDATVHGLLGLQVDPAANRAVFAPHLPAQWSGVTVERLRLGAAFVNLTLKQSALELTLSIDNSGAPFHLDFVPEIPLGAHVRNAELDHKRFYVASEDHPQETDAHAKLDLPRGKSELHIALTGGVRLLDEAVAPLIGATSHGVRVIATRLEANTLTLVADLPRDRAAHLALETGWQLVKCDGASATATAAGIDLAFPAEASETPSSAYRRVTAVVQFKP